MLDPVYLKLLANSVEYATFLSGLGIGFVLTLMLMVYAGWQEQLFLDEEEDADVTGQA